MWGAQSLPYSYGFEDFNLETDGWTKQNPSNKNNGEFKIAGSGVQRSGSYGFRFSSYTDSGESTQYLISPELDSPNGVIVTFWYKASNSSGSELFKVGYSTSGTEITDFIFGDQISTSSTSWKSYENTFPVGTKYIAVYYYANYQYRLYVDDFGFESAGLSNTCPAPSALTKGAITATSATFTWTAGGEETAWQYICLPAATDVDWSDANVKTATSATATVENLGPSTAYKFYVRADCSSEQSSETSVAFKTPCVAIATLPWTDEDFADVTTGSSVYNIPDCWDRIAFESYYGTMPYVQSGSSGHTGSGSKNLYFYGGMTPAAIILPAFAEKTGKLAISFWYNNNSTYAYYGFAQIGYMTDPADASTFVMLKQLDKVASYTAVSNFAMTGAPDDAYIAIRYAGGSSDYGSLYIDGISVDLAPSCVAPGIPEASSITTNSASIAWTANSGETAWKLQYSTDNENWLDANNGNAVTNPYTLSELNAATLYYVRVKAVCSATEESAYSESASFRTACGIMAALDEKFDSYAANAQPACWQWITYYDDWEGISYPLVSASASNAFSGNNSLAFYGGGSATTSPIAILPQFEDQISTLALSFYYKNSSTYSSYAQLKVGYMTDPSNASTFTAVETLAKTTTYTKVGPFIFSNAPENAYFAIQFTGGTSDYGYAYIDNVIVEEAPSCIQPSGLAASSVTDNSASITWTAGGSESAWVLQYKAYDGDWSADINVTSPSYPLTGLAANTNYYVHVKAVCGENEESDWTSSINFKTACGVNAMPFTEDFGTTSAIPDCWTVGKTGGSYQWAPNYDTYPNYYLQFRTSSGSTYSYLTLPAIELTEDAQLTFDWRNSNNVTADLLISTDGGTTFTSIPNHGLSTTASSWAAKKFDLSAYTGETVIISFRGYNGTASRYLRIDNIHVEAKPCEALAAPTAVPTVDGGTITWTGNAKALRYKADGANDWTTVNISGSSYLLTGLQASSAYNVQVQAACAEGAEDLWSATLTFTTKCAASSVLPYENNFENEALNEIPACWDRISASAYPQVVSGAAAYGGSGKALYFYGNTNQTAVLPAFTQALNTLSISFYYKSDYSSHYEVGYLEADGATFHTLASLTAKSSFASEPYELDLTNAPAEAAYLAILYTGATSSYATGYIDNVVVRKTPTCFKPASAAVASYTDNSAVINWTASTQANESQYQYVCVLSNATPDWNNATLTDQLTATVENLTAHKAYDFYVRSYCGDEQSDAVKVSFTTACSVISALPWEYDFEDDDTWGYPECWNKFEHGYSGVYVVNNSGHNAAQSLYALGGSTSAYTTVILPKFAAALNTLAISFYYSGNEDDENHAYGKAQVGYMTNIEDESSFVMVKEFAPADAYKQAVVSFAGVSASANIAIRYAGGSSEGDLYIDDIRVARAEVFNDNANNETRFATLAAAGETIDVIFNRTLLGNGDYNTFCLPFSLSADQLAESPIANFKIKAFDYASIDNGELLLAIADASSIEAGVPYFVANKANEANQTEQLYKDVVISAATPGNVDKGDITFQGVFNPVNLDAQGESDAHDQLFLAKGNKIYWPAQDKTVKGFRAYFQVAVGGLQAIRRDMPARIVEHAEVATGIEDVQSDVQSLKLLENGTVIIIRNGVKYNIQGQVIQ